MDFGQGHKLHFLNVTTVSSPSLEVGSIRVELLAKLMTLKCHRGVLLRCQPVAVLVSEDGSSSRLSITNQTRLAQVGIVTVALLCVGGMWLRGTRRKEKSS